MRLAVRRYDLVCVPAIADRLHAVFRIQSFEVWNAAPAHHSRQAAGLLRKLWRLARLGCLAEKPKQGGARSHILHSRAGHVITRNQPIRISYRLLTAFVIQSDPAR